MGQGWGGDFFFIRPLPWVNSPTDSAEDPEIQATSKGFEGFWLEMDSAIFRVEFVCIKPLSVDKTQSEPDSGLIRGEAGLFPGVEGSRCGNSESNHA